MKNSIKNVLIIISISLFFSIAGSVIVFAVDLGCSISGESCGVDRTCCGTMQCKNGFCVDCTPSCSDCGADNGCGGTCLTGSCPFGQECENGVCTSCITSSRSCSSGSSDCCEGLVCQSDRIYGVYTCRLDPNRNCNPEWSSCDSRYDIPCCEGLGCVNRNCIYCGTEGKPCCDNSVCNSNLRCYQDICVGANAMKIWIKEPANTAAFCQAFNSKLIC